MHTYTYVLLFQLHTLQGCSTAQHRQSATCTPLEGPTKSRYRITHAHHSLPWKPLANEREKGLTPLQCTNLPPNHLGGFVLIFFFRLNRFNSSNEYRMSSQATAWVKN